MKSIQKWFQSLSPNMKVLVVIVAVIVLWLLFQKLKAVMSTTKKQIQEKTEIEQLKENGVKATYKPETYKKFADQLQKAMEGVGTDEYVITKVFSYLNNDLDFIHLDAAFGVRESADNWFGLADPTDMKGWLRDDLSEALIKQINQMLKNKGITKSI